MTSISVPIMDAVLSGYNSNVFSIGGSRTGKSTLFYGSVIPGILTGIFDKLDFKRYVYRIRCSYLELVGEQMRDLLVLEQQIRDPLHLRYHPSLGLLVEGLTNYEVEGVEDVQKMLDFAFKLRALRGGEAAGHTVLSFFLERYARVFLPDEPEVMTNCNSVSYETVSRESGLSGGPSMTRRRAGSGGRFHLVG